LSIYNAISDNKDLKSQLNKKNYLYLLTFVSLFFLDYLFFHSFNEALKASYAGLILTGVTIVIILTLKFGLNIWFKLSVNKLNYLSSVDMSGFTIFKNDKQFSYSWMEFNDAVFDNTKQKLRLKGTRNIVIKKSLGNWYKLLKTIPRTFPGLDYSYIDGLFNDLQTCMVCGMVAANALECMYCASDIWSDDLKSEFESEEKYIIENQLDEFATMDKTEKFCNFILKDTFFNQDPNWKPLVTKEQVLEYSKNEYWDEKQN
jgi:hypothetical protein